jgi:methylisocitrate lyase
MVDRVKAAATRAPTRLRDHGPHRRAGRRRLNAASARCLRVEAGADMIFPEAMTELPMYRQFGDAVKVPILANITEFGQTPLFTVEELRTADVAMVLYCCSAFRAMNKAALNVYQTIRREGTQKNLIPVMQTRAELYEYLDYHAYETEARRAVRTRQGQVTPRIRRPPR